MKLKYFRIKNEVYFTILVAINSMQKMQDFYKRMNLNAELHVMHQKYSFRCTLINDDYLFKMIKCCGNSFFNIEDKFYYVKPHDFVPVYLYFKNTVMTVPDKTEKLEIISSIIKKQLIEYGHFEFVNDFSVIKSTDKFQREFDRLELAITQFLEIYYSISPPKAELKKKKKIIVRRLKK